MNYNSKNIPNISEIGMALEKKGMVKFENGYYVQRDANCFEIALELAPLFGVNPIRSKKDLTDIIFNWRDHKLFGNPLVPRFDHDSNIFMVIRSCDNPRDIHVSIEAFGRDYNYGPCEKDGFQREFCVPLY